MGSRSKNGSTFVAIALIVCAMLSLASCSYAKGVAHITDGQAFPAEKAPLVKEGMLPEQVRRILGEPFKVSGEGATLRWRYYAQHRQEDIIRCLGLVRLPASPRVWKEEMIIEFQRGLVRSVEYKLEPSQSRL